MRWTVARMLGLMLATACGEDDPGLPELRICERPLAALCERPGACAPFDDAVRELRETPPCAEGIRAVRRALVKDCGSVRTIEHPGYVGSESFYDGAGVVEGVYVWSDIVIEEGCFGFRYGHVGACETVAETVCLAPVEAGGWCRASCG